MHVFSDAKPVRWPDGWVRTPPRQRMRAYFRAVTPPMIRRRVLNHLAQLGADAITITSSQPLGFQGTWTLGDGDPAVAVHFELAGQRRVLACDLYGRPDDNLQAISLAAESLVMLRKVGANQIFLHAMDGLCSEPVKTEPVTPDPNAKPWWEVLGFDRIPTRDLAEKAHRALIRENHPDRPGGSEERTKAITIAMAAARDYYSDPPPTS